ncbi:MAG: hypothetical protein EB057_02665 [Microbacteriaceae bacterium]|nr:hypothetical protein [Microbacteriaceae bacterium]
MTEQEKLDEALDTISHYLRAFGLDTHLGHRTPQTLRLSAEGAEKIAELLRRFRDGALARLQVEREWNAKWGA